MNPETKQFVLDVLYREVVNAMDNVARAKMEWQRNAFNHDNNDALVRYKQWADKANAAYKAVEQL